MDTRHVVVGAGSFGSVLAAYLARGHQRVVLVEASPLRRAEIQCRGVRLEGFRGDEQVLVDVIAPDRVPDLAPLEWVFLAVKPDDLDAALEPLLPVTGPQTTFVSFLGGLTPFTLATRVGRDRTVVAVANFESRLRPDGVVETDFHNFVWLGELDGRFTPRLAALQLALSWVAPALVTRVIEGMVWSKAVYSLEVALSTLVDEPPLDVYADREARRLAAALVRENIALAEACGVEPIAFDFFDPNLYKATNAGQAKIMDIWIRNAWYRHEGFRTGFDYPFPPKAGLSWSLSPANPRQETTTLLRELDLYAEANPVPRPMTARFDAVFHAVAGGERPPGWDCLRALARDMASLGVVVPG